MTTLSFAALAIAAACRAGEPGAPIGDVDGDGVDDAWSTSGGSGSMMAGTSWTLTLSTGARIEGAADFAFGAMINVHDIPEALEGPNNTRLREAVEARLFERVCDEADPSLAWLLDDARGKRALRWQEGAAPATPQSYTIVVRDDALVRALATDARGDVWVSYSGATHTQSGIVGTLAAPALVVEQRGRALLRTHHGLVLVDTKRGRHAWVWVTRSAWKLRFRTICPNATTDGARVTLPFDPHSPYDEGDTRPELVVDLQSGRAQLRHRAKEPSWRGCQARD